MPFKNEAGLGVHNFYGARDTGGSVGVETSNDSVHRLVINFNSDMLNGGFIPPVVIPKGALFRDATLVIEEAFNVTGTSPTVSFGAAGSVATNGITLSEAELEAVGTKKPASTGAGTWAQGSATGTTAAAKVAVALGGTSPAVAAGTGKGVLILSYTKKAKA